jgi:hypothetical protein
MNIENIENVIIEILDFNMLPIKAKLYSQII